MRLDRLDPQDEALSLIEQDTWTLALSDAGRYHYTALRTSFMDLTDPGAPQLLEQERQEVLEETSGHYTLIGEALVLTPDDETQAKVESIFRDGVIRWMGWCSGVGEVSGPLWGLGAGASRSCSVVTSSPR